MAVAFAIIVFKKTECLKVFKTLAAPGVLKIASFTNDFSPFY